MRSNNDRVVVGNSVYTGDLYPLGGYKLMIERFLSKVNISSWGCWSWLASLDKDGYGFFRVGKKQKHAYRVAYEMFVNDIPEGLQIDHLCRNRACVNPQHMEVVSPFANTLRGYGITSQQLQRTLCPKGHKYDKVREYKKGKYCRRCSICHAERTLISNRRRYRKHVIV